MARTRPEYPVALTDQDSANLAERLTGSFVQGGLSQIVTEKRQPAVRSDRWRRAEPGEPESGKYPYEKDFYLVYSAKTKATAERLLEFVRSEKGRSILRETGNFRSRNEADDVFSP